jgi:hypothetical protein
MKKFAPFGSKCLFFLLLFVFFYAHVEASLPSSEPQPREEGWGYLVDLFEIFEKPSPSDRV